MRRQETPKNIAFLGKVIRVATETSKRARQEKWLERYDSFGQHTALTEL